MLFTKSSANHNFNVFFDNNKQAYCIQVYLAHSIRISTPMRAADFLAHWHALATDEWAVAYRALFSVAPDAKGNEIDAQYVSVLQGA